MANKKHIAGFNCWAIQMHTLQSTGLVALINCNVSLFPMQGTLGFEKIWTLRLLRGLSPGNGKHSSVEHGLLWLRGGCQAVMWWGRVESTALDHLQSVLTMRKWLLKTTSKAHLRTGIGREGMKGGRVPWGLWLNYNEDYLSGWFKMIHSNNTMIDHQENACIIELKSKLKAKPSDSVQSAHLPQKSQILQQTALTFRRRQSDLRMVFLCKLWGHLQHI